MEKRFLVEHMETNFLIKNTLESSFKSFNDSVLFNMNLLMQQRLPPYVQPPPPQPTITLAPATTKNHVSVPLPSPWNHHHQTLHLRPLRVDYDVQCHFLFLFKPIYFDNDKGGESIIGILIYKTLVLSAKFNKTSVTVVTYVCFHVFFPTHILCMLWLIHILIHA